MSDETKDVRFKYCVRINRDVSGCELEFYDPKTNESELWVQRYCQDTGDEKGRWKWPGGHWTSTPSIACEVFEYPVPPSLRQIEYMEDFIDMLGLAIDACIRWSRAEAKRIYRSHEERRLKEKQEREDSIAKASVRPCRNSGPDKLYLMKHVNGLVKIGVSKNPKAREKTLQAEDPRLHKIFECEASYWAEARLHKIFADLRVRGEWFNLDQRHVDWITLFCGYFAKFRKGQEEFA